MEDKQDNSQPVAPKQSAAEQQESSANRAAEERRARIRKMRGWLSPRDSEVDDFAGTEFDAASKEWGEEWRTPTKQQAEVLLANCSLEWVTENSVEGARLTGANGGSIFLPATGYRIYSFLCDDFEGSYWTSTPVSSTSSSAYRLEVASEWAGMDKSLSKIYGNALRPVSAVTGSDFLRYDVNKDGSVGVTDVMLLVNWIMNTESE